MVRKTTDGPLRNKERTKAKLLESLAQILQKDGFRDLSVSKLASAAKIDRKLIYDYFGSLEGVIKEYLLSKDYWSVKQNEADEIIKQSREDFGKQAATYLATSQIDALLHNSEMRNIILWGLIENTAPLLELAKEREKVGELLFSTITDLHFQGKDKNIRAVEALLISGVYYLTLQSCINGIPFCGIDIQTEEGKNEIKKTIAQIIDFTYS